MAGWAATPAWADRFCTVRSRGYRWFSITTAWVRIRLAPVTAALGARAFTPTTVSRSSTTTSLQNVLDKMAFSFTGDLGCEYGGGGSFGAHRAE